ESRRGFRETGHVGIRPKLHLAAVDLKNVHSALHIRQRHGDLAIESTWTRERGIEHVDAIRRGAHDHLFVGFEAVHLDEDGVKGLLALIMSAGAKPAAAASA